MDLVRVTGLLSLAALAACLDPTSARTRRDFEEIGWSKDRSALINQGVWVEDPAALRFRANAPEVAVALSSTGTEDSVVRVRLDNVEASSEVVGAEGEIERGRKSLSFDVRVPGGGAATVATRRSELASAQDFRFAWVGDVQSGLEKFGRIREVVNADPGLEFVLFAGDVTQNGSQEEIDAFLTAADALERPWYSVFGNHETTFGRGEEFQRTIGRVNLSFEYRGARFVILDTASATVDPRAYDWLGTKLSAEGPALRIAGMHVPPLDYEGMRDAGFASRAEGAKLLAQLAEGGVDLLLAGHLHTLRFGGNAGIQQVISGNGGVGVSDRLDGTGMHFLSVLARPGEQRLEVSVVKVP